MEFIHTEQPTVSATAPTVTENASLPCPPRDSAAVRRLMDEVRNEHANAWPAATAYDRVHNRHNR
mgnify:CR=1 FL=1